MNPPCVGTTDLFYSDDPDDQAIARRMCFACPVQEQCLLETLAVEQKTGRWIFGVAGGLTAAERCDMINKRTATEEDMWTQGR